jgi:hypothetical protein
VHPTETDVDRTEVISITEGALVAVHAVQEGVEEGAVGNMFMEKDERGRTRIREGSVSLRAGSKGDGGEDMLQDMMQEEEQQQQQQQKEEEDQHAREEKQGEEQEDFSEHMRYIVVIVHTVLYTTLFVPHSPSQYTFCTPPSHLLPLLTPLLISCRQVFWFGSPVLFHKLMQLLLLANCFYLSMYAVYFVKAALHTFPHDTATLYIALCPLPSIIVSVRGGVL